MDEPAGGGEADGTLSGTVVLDLTRVLAGPWCTQMLGDFGADVIKIERPGTGDDTRAWGPPWLEASGQRQSSFFGSANRNKRSVALDISTPYGQDVVRRLAAKADVLVENYKAGDLARYGLDYASLAPVNPRLVYCSITGYGQNGPYAQRPGYDFVFQGEAGLMSVTGEADHLPGGGPQKMGVAVVDMVTGMYACSAILAALAHRERSGRGQAIDMALFDCALALGANHAFNHLVTGSVPVRYGNASAALVPYQSFKTADGHVVVVAGNDTQWQRLCRAIDRPDLAADARYMDATGRITHRQPLVEQLEQSFLSRTTAQWQSALEKFEVPHGPINDYRQAFEHPQVRHRDMLVRVPRADGGTLPGVGNPVRFSEAPVRYERCAPALGEHTQEVLRQFGIEP